MSQFIHPLLQARSIKERRSGHSVWFRQEKVDGWRMAVFIQRDGSMIATGKDQSPHLEFFSRFPRLQQAQVIQDLRKLPPLTSIEFEIKVPGQPAEMVATALRDPSIPLEFHAFALPVYNGVHHYASSLEWCKTQFDGYGIPALPYTRLTDQPDADYINEILHEAKSNGREGWMLKQSNYHGWWKVKVEETVDCFITGYFDGEGKYINQMGALVVSAFRDGKQVTIASVSGMTDEVRAKISANPGLYFDRVIEVRCQGWTKGGRLRHPRFIRFRDDKSRKDCVV